MSLISFLYVKFDIGRKAETGPVLTCFRQKAVLCVVRCMWGLAGQQDCHVLLGSLGLPYVATLYCYPILLPYILLIYMATLYCYPILLPYIATKHGCEHT